MSGIVDGILHGFCHPYLGDKHHKAKTNGAAVFGGMMAVIVHKIRRREANADESGNVVRRELRALAESGVIFKDLSS